MSTKRSPRAKVVEISTPVSAPAPAPAEKDPAAVALGRKRWVGTTTEERKEATTEAIRARWKGASLKKRKAQGKMLAEARAKKRAEARAADAATRS